MDLQELLNKVNYISNKSQSGYTLTPVEYNEILPIVNVKVFNKLYGLMSDYRINLPQSEIAYEKSKAVTDSLQKFKTPTDVTLVNSKWTLPTDYMHLSSIRYNYIDNSVNCTSPLNTASIEVLTDAEIGDRLTNAITAPTRKNPVCTIISDYVEFYPTLQYVKVTYLRKPVTPIYAYTINPTTYAVTYNQSGSTQFEYSDVLEPFVISEILELIGVNLKENEIVQYSKMMEKESL